MVNDADKQSPLVVEPIAGVLGVVVHVDEPWTFPLATPLVDALHSLVARHGVVVLRGLDLDRAGHLALGRQLGEIRNPPEYFPTLRDEGFPEIGTLVSPGMGSMTDVWHSDVTWSPRPPRYSILHMRTCPPAGGDTMWASLTDAHDRLSGPMRRFLEGLTAEHSSGAERRAVHPVVQVHPITGRHALAVNPLFTKRIVELDDDESRAVLDLLFGAITRPEGVCRWSWREGDLAIWDNHFVLHYVVQDYGDSPRVIERVEIEGQPLVPVGSHRDEAPSPDDPPDRRAGPGGRRVAPVRAGARSEES
jgi:taurine dioxygenase